MPSKDTDFWIIDDVSWCADTECNRRDCPRNIRNMKEDTGVRAFAMFRGTPECLIEPEKEGGNSE